MPRTKENNCVAGFDCRRDSKVERWRLNDSVQPCGVRFIAASLSITFLLEHLALGHSY